MRTLFHAIGLGAYLFLLGGIIFHTSEGNPSILHKYSPLGAGLILAMAALTIPYAAGVRRATKAFFEPRTLRLPGGKTRIIGPGTRMTILAAVSLAVLLVSLTAVEIWQRTVTPPQSADRFHPFLQGAAPKNDPVLHTNRYGFRGEEIASPKPRGEYRIFVLGGSTAFCESIPYEQNPARLLEKALQARYPGRHIRVWNAGYLWYTSEHSLIQYLTVLKDMEPDMIVMWHGINDLFRSFSPPTYAHGDYRADYGHYDGPAGAMVQDRFSRPFLRVRSLALEWFLPCLERVLNAFYSDLRGARTATIAFTDLSGFKILRRPGQPIAATEFRSLSAYHRNLESFAELCKADHVALVVGTQPSLYRQGLNAKEAASVILLKEMSCDRNGNYADMNSMILGIRRFNEETRSFARRHGLPLADLDMEVPKTGEFLYDDCHFTPPGGQRVAEALARTVIQSGLLAK